MWIWANQEESVQPTHTASGLQEAYEPLIWKSFKYTKQIKQTKRQNGIANNYLLSCSELTNI